MNLFHPQMATALAATISLAACVAAPVAPTIPVAPGPNKTFDAFNADQEVCQQYAAAQTAPAAAAANNQAIGGALLSSALGAGLGAGIGAAAGNAGKGAAIGAASGGALGIFGNAGGAPYAQGSLQQQFDVWYGQCMMAHGNSVPALSPPPYRGGPSPPPGPPPPPGPGPGPYPGQPVPRRDGYSPPWGALNRPLARPRDLIASTKNPAQSPAGFSGGTISVHSRQSTMTKGAPPPGVGAWLQRCDKARSEAAFAI
jgi:hypothetical protein